MSTQLKCKPEELVRYVGRGVTDVAPNCYGWVGKTVRSFDRGLGPEWVVDPPIPTTCRVEPWRWVFDRSLRPIRGGETPEQSTEAMRRLHETPAKEPVVKPFQWEEL